MFTGFCDQNKNVQVSVACQRGLRRAQGDTIEPPWLREWCKVRGTAVRRSVHAAHRMVLCSRALRESIEEGHDGQMSV